MSTIQHNTYCDVALFTYGMSLDRIKAVIQSHPRLATTEIFAMAMDEAIFGSRPAHRTFASWVQGIVLASPRSVGICYCNATDYQTIIRVARQFAQINRGRPLVTLSLQLDIAGSEQRSPVTLQAASN